LSVLCYGLPKHCTQVYLHLIQNLRVHGSQRK